jgi:hypothetical protein
MFNIGIELPIWAFIACHKDERDIIIGWAPDYKCLSSSSTVRDNILCQQFTTQIWIDPRLPMF